MSGHEGLLNIDKPAGITSHDVVQQVRRVTGVRRVGHAGTLDPLATGILLVGVGRTTRLIEYLVGQPKLYEAEVRLGQATNTYDTEGEVVAERPFSSITSEMIAGNLAPFRGQIEQRPPIYSAIKKDGQPLYKLARQGIEVEVPMRQVTIYALEMLAYDAPFVNLRVTCSAGTYIRSLAHDLGQALGCGGHLTALRRTAIGTFGVETAVSLTNLTPATLATYLQPADTAVAHLPRLTLTTPQAHQWQQGIKVAQQPDQPLESPLARTYDESGRFIGISAAQEGHWQPKKVLK
ncbi:MAG: tRNA pseudouridine(55) synthase TruB [Chloroflexota bacterium]